MAESSDKDDFFTRLDRLDDDSTASEDDNNAVQPPVKVRKIEPNSDTSKIHGKTVTNNRLLTNVKPDLPRSIPPLVRAGTDTQEWRSKRSKLSHESCRVRRTNSEPKQVAAVKAPTLTTRALFEGCNFYFVPNNSISKVRRLRIHSAVSQGARWIQQLDSTVTHVIVDSNLPSDAVIKSLNSKIDFATVPVVRDKWLIESLTHRVRKDVCQSRFLLQGMPELVKKSTVEPTTLNVPATGKVSNARQNNRSAESTEVIAAPSATPSDELAGIMKALKETKHLPLDAELDLDKFITYSSGDEEENESISAGLREKLPPKENKGFACMEAHTGQSDDNPNNRTIEVLQMMATYYDRTGDHWRTTAYRKAISALRKQNQLVSTKQEALQIFGIGNRLADKIEEIVTTNRLQRLESTLTDPNDKVLQLFMGVYGAGLRQARLWIDQGYRTLHDLKANAPLSDNHKTGIEHYDDFQQRIPRDEVAQHGAIVQTALYRVDKRLQAIIGGSYRRGMLDSGDIDVMITHDNAELPQLRKWVFEEAVPYLFHVGFMRYAFATSRSRGRQVQKTPTRNQKSASDKDRPEADAFADSSDTGTKFHGASVVPATVAGQSMPWRRIDLLLVPASALGASLLYFTGNDIFNRSMRLLASRKGMRLNQYGLYKNVLRGKGRVKETEGELLEGRSERRIFELLGVPWREPEERRC